MSETREIPCRGARMSALRSVLQFRDYFEHMGSWVDKAKAEAGAPIFFAHLGMPSIVVTDVVAAANIFAAPKDVVDRIGQPGFGPIELRERLTGGILPAVVSHGEKNASTRRFLDAMLEDARGRFDEMLTKSLEDIAAEWVASGGVTLNAVSGVSGKMTGRWLLDIDLDAAEVSEWPGLTFGIKTSSRLVNFVLGTLNRPKKSAVEMSDRLVETFRKAPRLDHICRIGKDAGLDEEETLRQMAFFTLFNTGALGRVAGGALAQLKLTPEWATAIRNELGDKQLVPSAMNEFPILDKVFTECCRLFGRPRAYYRRALKDFDLPCGDGHIYRVLEGDTLLLSMRSIHHDERMFTDGHSFNPKRFDDNPKLLHYVFIFGPHDKPYRCAPADLGMADVFFKYVLGRLVQGYTWDISPPPEIHADNVDDVAPEDVSLVNFRPRS